MPRDLATSDSSDAVDLSYLLATFEGGDNPTNLDPVMQSILDVVGTVLAGLGEFAYDDSTNALTFTLTNNSVTAAQARATANAHVREWRSRLGIGDDWSEIPSGTAIGLGKVVEHGGAYFGCITAHNRGGTGPDGDAANWVLLSNYRGNWVDAWYPAGSFVRHAGLPYVATVAVARGDPAPNASNNVKWLLLGALPPTVVNVSNTTSIPATANGNTYRVTGNVARTITLPDPATINVGFFVRVANGSAEGTNHSVARQGAGQSIEGGAGPVSVASGEVITFQLVNANEWEIIADTTRGGTSGGGITAAERGRLLPVFPGTGSRDNKVPKFNGDVLGWEEDAVGTAGAIADNSILPSKVQADTAARKKAWRDRLDSSHIGLVANALPDIANHNVGDTLIIGRGGATVVPFREIDEPSVELLATVAGDVMMLLGAGWTRIGNFFSGGIAAAAAQSKADANELAIATAVSDIQQSALHVSILWPDGTSNPLSYMTARTLLELFQWNGERSAQVLQIRSPVGFQIEGYIRGFDGIANLSNIAINGVVIRDNSALTFEERIENGHFNLVAHPNNQHLLNVQSSLDQGYIEFEVRYTISGSAGSYALRVPLLTTLPLNLPARVPYIHPEYFLEDVARRISELQVEEDPPVWSAATQGEIAGVNITTTTGMAILAGTLDPDAIPEAVISALGTEVVQATTSTVELVILARIQKGSVDRRSQVQKRFRLLIDRGTGATVTTPVGVSIFAEDANFYYINVGTVEASPSRRATFNLQQLTNPFRTIYNDILGPRALASMPQRFERAVGASASVGNVPAGTFELSVLIGPVSGNYAEKRVLISNLTAANRQFYYRVDRGAEDGTIVNLAYNAGSRTLTYTAHREGQTGTARTIAIKAIGEA